MKNIFTTVFISAFFSASLLAQSFNIGITGGYNAPLAGSFNTVNATQFENVGFPQYYTSLQTVTSASFGQGGNIALNLDWFSKKNIGCGLTMNALISSPYSYSTTVNYLSGVSAQYNFTDHPFSFQFIPHISFKHDFKVVSPILEVGMLVGITHVTEDYEAVGTNGTQIQSSINNHGNVMLGFYSSLGLAFKVSRVVRIMLAVTCSAASYSPSGWTRTSFVVNNTNQLSSLSTSELQGVYVKSMDQTVPQSSSQPHESLKFSMPFSNVGFNAGIAFVISKKKDKAKEKQDVKSDHSF